MLTGRSYASLVAVGTDPAASSPYSTRVRPLESVPNVSEGRDATVIDAVGDAFEWGGARVLDVHSDADHHRSVFTLVGSESELEEGLLAGVAEAQSLIDLREHHGAHPRVGVVDVVPIVPLASSDMPRAVDLAAVVARRVGDELGIPVFLYGESGSGRRPVDLRRGGLDALRARVERGEVAPDAGPSHVEPSTGAVLVGARSPLIAYNVLLESTDVEAARAIAAAVRESSGGLPGVQAIGLELERQGAVQVSTNVTDVEATPLHVLHRSIVEAASTSGVAVGAAELVGLVPAAAVIGAARDPLGLGGLGPGHVLELRLLESLADDASAGE
jgi:glutamate formiminotransferase / 5-formyltetrahydrofolate cyclo-ligase